VTGGFADEIAAGANAATGLAPDYDTALEAERTRDRSIPLTTRLPGEIAGMAAQTALTGGAAAPATLSRALLRGGAQGGLYGFGSGEGGLESRAKNAALTGAVGVAGGALGHGTSRLVKPQPRPEVADLMKEGVRPTIGQIGGGVLKRTEEKLTSVPLLGDAIRAGSRRANAQFNIAAINKALKPAGLSLPKEAKAGHESVEAAHAAVSKAYDDLLPSLSAKTDGAFHAGMNRLASKAKADLTPDLRKVFNNQMMQIAGTARARKTTMPGPEAKEIMSRLGTLSAQFRKSTDAFQRNLGDLYGEARKAFQGMLVRSNPDAAQSLRRLDRSYALLLRVENAAAKTSSKGGEFSPAALNQATRALDPSLRKRSFAQGNAVGQDFATSAEKVLGNPYPDSGTAGRLLGAAGLAGGAAISPPTAAAIMAPSIAYTPPVQNFLAHLLAGQRPQFMGPIADAFSATVAPGASVLSQQR
jgi:hypothetical protein